MNWHRLVKGEDGGGVRFYLDGRPIAAGTGLELRLRGGGALRVRFEVEHDPDAGPGPFVPSPVLYLPTGCDPYPLDAGDPESATSDHGAELVCRPAWSRWEDFDLRWPERR